jgi:hypothetical protein
MRRSRVVGHQGNNKVSIAVRTQYNRWAMIPRTKKLTMHIHKGHPNTYEINHAAKIVMITSMIATPRKRYEWTPCPGLPNISLCLHKEFIIEDNMYKID